jgi:hypothetical protein
MGDQGAYILIHSLRKLIISSLVSTFFLIVWADTAPLRSEPSDNIYLKLESTTEALPEEIQVSLLLKILTYDRSMEEEGKDTLKIGVLYYPHDDQSQKNRDAIIKYLKGNQDKTINGSHFSIEEIGFVSIGKLNDVVARKNVKVLYITSDGNNNIKKISELTQAQKILTITGRIDYVNRGLSVGLGIQDEKPQIVINLPSVRAEGSDFGAKLLKLCKILN